MASSRVPIPATDRGIKVNKVLRQKQAAVCQRFRGKFRARAENSAARILHPQAANVRARGQTSRQVA